MYDQSRVLPAFDVRQKTVLLAGGANQILLPDANRVGLFISNHTGNTLFASNEGSVNSAGGKWSIPNGTTYEVWWEIHGAIVTLGWWFAAFQAGVSMSYTELLFYEPRL